MIKAGVVAEELTVPGRVAIGQSREVDVSHRIRSHQLKEAGEPSADGVIAAAVHPHVVVGFDDVEQEVGKGEEADHEGSTHDASEVESHNPDEGRPAGGRPVEVPVNGIS